MSHKEEQGQKQQAEPEVKSRIVNRFNLATLSADTATAVFVAGTASVGIAIIDRSIIAKVAGVNKTMGEGLKDGIKTLCTSPYNFFIKDKPKGYMALVYHVCFATYFMTYLAANTTRTWYESQGESKEKIAVMAGITSSAVNTGMTVWKDSVILRNLPVKTGASATTYVPWLSKGLFTFRDSLTCIAAFTITPLLKDYFVSTGWNVDQAKTTASLVTPVSMQFITTFVHIPAIVYQRQYDATGAKKWGGPEGYGAAIMNQMKIDYIGALRLRMLRIFIAFGIGTLVTSDMRLGLMTKWAGKDAISRV